MSQDCRPRKVYRLTNSGNGTSTLTVIGDLILVYSEANYYLYNYTQDGQTFESESYFVPAQLESTFLPEGCEEEPSDRYDCLNGNCVISTQYETPGLYSSLEECLLSCEQDGQGCPDGSSCVSNESAALLKKCICG